METLFSTVAQISFTIVGLFFVALTVDSESRNFWLGDKALNKYVTVIFFILLLPGFISIGWLIPFSVLGLPAWVFVTLVLLVVYSYAYWELRSFYKSSAYKQIAHYESAVDAKGALKFGIPGLALLTIAGFYSSAMSQEFYDFLMGSLGIFLFLLVTISVVPVYMFLRKGAESKFEKGALAKDDEVKELYKPAHQVSVDATSIKSLFVLLGILISFLLGRFLSKD